VQSAGVGDDRAAVRAEGGILQLIA
jgi:hypothetical protein